MSIGKPLQIQHSDLNVEFAANENSNKHQQQSLIPKSIESQNSNNRIIKTSSKNHQKCSNLRSNQQSNISQVHPHTKNEFIHC